MNDIEKPKKYRNDEIDEPPRFISPGIYTEERGHAYVPYHNMIMTGTTEIDTSVHTITDFNPEVMLDGNSGPNNPPIMITNMEEFRQHFQNDPEPSLPRDLFYLNQDLRNVANNHELSLERKLGRLRMLISLYEENQ